MKHLYGAICRFCSSVFSNLSLPISSLESLPTNLVTIDRARQCLKRLFAARELIYKRDI